MRRGSILIWFYYIGIIFGFSCVLCEEEEEKKEDKCCSSPNVRTVIFGQTDMDKECWSREEVALLFTRRMMQELLPKRRPTAVPLLLDYFKECLETVKKLATSRRTHTLIVTALADTLGGYLQAFGLPMAHQAFYEGTLGYNGARQLHELQDAFKKLLRTDGGGWTKPIRIKRSGNVTPLRLSKAPPGVDPCSSLVTRNELTHESGATGVEILMPFLDDALCPSAIALPFKDRNLYSLNSKACANVLVKYYSRSVWCLTQTYGTSSLPESGPSHVPQVQCFFTSFSLWISSYVLPRLRDSTFYPAFGSVLRLVETLNCKVRESKTIRERVFNRGEHLATIELVEECEEPGVGDNVTPRRFYIIVISSLVIAFWIIVLIVYILYKWFSKKRDEDECDSTTLTSSEEGSTPEESSGEQSVSSYETKKKKKKKKKPKPGCDDA